MRNPVWTNDPRVTAIVARIRRNPPVREAYRAASDSSWGDKTYFRYTGDLVDELAAIRREYVDHAFAIETAFPDDFRRAMKAPSVDDLIDYALGLDVDTRFDGRGDYPSRREYLAMCAAALPVEMAA